MSEMTESATVIPQLTLGWRMQMSLRQSDLSVQAMADHLGVTRQTVGRWINDRGAAPKKAYITQWAWLTRVPVTWLETGVSDFDGPTRNSQGGDAAITTRFSGETSFTAEMSEAATRRGNRRRIRVARAA